MRRAVAVGALLTGLIGLVGAPVALGDGRTRSTTRDGMTLTVTPATGLDPAGRAVRVTGRGYDVNKGIYVAFCVDNGPGTTPTPCGGGQDQQGTSGNSVWISSFPPYYGTGLAQPYGEGGTFDVTIRVQAQLNDGVDCRTTRCAVVTRADHTASDDRSLDVAVPVDFTTTPKTPTRTSATSARPAPSRSAGLEKATAPRATATSALVTTSPAATAATASAPLPAAGTDHTPAGPAEVAAAERSDEGADVGAVLMLGLVGLGLVGAAATTVLLRRRSSP